MATQCVKTVFKGSIIHSLSLDNLEVLPNALLGVDVNGKIAFLEKTSDDESLRNLQAKYQFTNDNVVDLGKKILIPGFIDTHTHAPQYVFTGTGTDLPLMKWLEKYTFRCEKKCIDDEFSRMSFTKAVSRHLSYGSTTCVYFSALYLNATQVLAEVVGNLGQRAFIGKVCMDQNSPADYVRSTEENVQETRSFIEEILKKNNPLITPVITPRFVPTCSDSLLQQLGEMGEKYGVPVQSHVSENKDEISFVNSLHPNCSYTGVYDKFKLMNERTIMAHGVHLGDDELKIFKERGSAISHCPVSNFSLCSGVFPTRKALDLGIKVGLGTDVAGGYSASLLQTVRQAISASNMVSLEKPELKPISWQEAFFLATVGGSQVIGMQDTLGNFLPGKYFDALVVDPTSEGSPIDVFSDDKLIEIFQKFIFLGDDRNIVQVWVNGNKLKRESN